MRDFQLYQFFFRQLVMHLVVGNTLVAVDTGVASLHDIDFLLARAFFKVLGNHLA